MAQTLHSPKHLATMREDLLTDMLRRYVPTHRRAPGETRHLLVHETVLHPGQHIAYDSVAASR